MKNQKQRNAELLFDAIGNLDDRLLQDALTWRPRNRLAIARAMLIAATLSLTAVLAISGVLLALRRDDAPNENLPPEENTETQLPAITLDTTLLACRDNVAYATMRADELSFYDGKACIVWQYADSDMLYVSRELTPQELAVLKAELGKGDRVGSDSPALACTVWVICGNGEVLSPYLESSTGNVGQGELFDYEAELIPSETLTSCILGILE